MKTGLDVICTLLRESVDLTVVVPVERIKGGRLPDTIGLPALLVKETSTVERQTLKREGKTRTIDRVSVTVRAGNYRDQRVVMDLVTRCCAGRTGAIAGAIGVSIVTAGRGPELDGPGDTFERTQDFKVSYDA